MRYKRGSFSLIEEKKMKKGLLIGCGVIVAIAIIGAIACGGFGYFKTQEFMGKNAQVVEQMIGEKMPQGYMAIMAMEPQATNPSAQAGKFAFLMGPNQNMVVLVEGPPIGSEEEKQKMFAEFQNQMNSQGSGGSADIQPAGKMTINGQEVDKYSITMTNQNGQQVKGIAVVISNQTSTLLAVVCAENSLFNEANATAFLQSIKK